MTPQEAERTVPATVSDAAHASSETTAEKIEEAVEVNEDPKVGQALDEASMHADATVRRVGWLRDWLHRLVHRSNDER